MGAFESYAEAETGDEPRALRSVLRADIGPAAENDPGDLRLIHQTLAGAGLLQPDTPIERTLDAVQAAIRHARTSHDGGRPDTAESNIRPGSPLERALRGALARGRFPLAHRALDASPQPQTPSVLVTGGMRRALGKLEEPQAEGMPPERYRRALLPSISAQTFQANRRLVDAVRNGGTIPGLDAAIATTIERNGKQGFVDVRDFISALQRRAPTAAGTLCGDIERHLHGPDLARFRKLRRGQPPTDGDFPTPATPKRRDAPIS